MRVCRLMLIAVMAITLAALPMAAVEMTHAENAQASMSAAGDECPCCNPAQPPEKCPLTCCHVQAIAVDGALIVPSLAIFYAGTGARRGTAISIQPDPPPPRS